MRVGIATVRVPFVSGGAETLADNLRVAINAAGHEAELIEIPFSWSESRHLASEIMACRLLEIARVDRLIGLKFPAYLLPHPDKAIWVVHQHRPAYDLWNTEFGDLHRRPEGPEVAALIRDVDTRLIPEARILRTISPTVTKRLRRWNGIAAPPLYHPPPLADRLVGGEAEPYLLLPGRINPMKRQLLAIEAMARLRSGKLIIMGAADTEADAEALRRAAASVGPARVEWRGHVSSSEKIELFAHAAAVVSIPYDEDFGYVALEAMLASKPVVTCTDSGGCLDFVAPRETGLIVAPDADQLARAFDAVLSEPPRARAWGRAGRRDYLARDISWSGVVSCLLA